MDHRFAIEPDPRNLPKLAVGTVVALARPAGVEGTEPLQLVDQRRNAVFQGMIDRIAGHHLRDVGAEARAAFRARFRAIGRADRHGVGVAVQDSSQFLAEPVRLRAAVLASLDLHGRPFDC